MEKLTNPHDRFFRQMFARQDVAEDFLRHYLPAGVVELLDLATLELSKDSFVDEALAEHFSDLLYKVDLVDGRPAYVYVLFEHKSYPDRLIALQLLRYMSRIWDQNVAQKLTLVPILPVVVYHGRTEWRVGLNLASLFPMPAALTEFVPDFRYWLVDLSRFSDEEIQGAIISRVVLLLLKYILQDDLPRQVMRLVPLLQELLRQRTGLAVIETVLRYLSQGTDKLDEEQFAEFVEEVYAEGDVPMPTLAEQWMERGLQQGLERGRREGILASIELGLELKFGAEGLKLLPEIAKIDDVDVLRAIREGLKVSSSLDEIRRIYE